MPEGADEVNEASRAVVAYFGVGCWLGTANLYDGDRTPLWRWDGSLVRTFGAGFVIKEFDQKLWDLILERGDAPYTGTKDDAPRVAAILDRIDELGGEVLAWS
jgi:hypothetical protein